jgi:NF-kappa-B inhibitor-like protein 2
MELWEDLFRCYAAEGSIHFRRGCTAKALLAYDKGYQAGERCEKKTQLSCELLSLKSDVCINCFLSFVRVTAQQLFKFMLCSQVLIMLSDYNGAKNALIKAYKMKTPDPKDRNEIEKKLRISKFHLLYSRY